MTSFFASVKSKMDEPVRVFIERAKAALSIETDEELASEIGYSKQAIANWRRRGAVPDKARKLLAHLAGPEFAAGEWDQLQYEQREKAILYACLTRVLVRLTSTYGGNLSAQNIAKLGTKFVELETGLLGHIRDRAFHGATEADVIEQLWKRIDEDKMMEVSWFFLDVGKALRKEVDQ